MFRKHLLALAVGLGAATGALAAPIQWAGNGHWYEYVGDQVTWDAAFAAANGASFMGMQGYLATVTSAGENLFVSGDAAGGQLSWLGGSDNGAEGNWTWRNGPENGQAFTFTNWNAGEPNNCCGGENYLHTNFAVFAGWNDHGGPAFPNQSNGYVIEYSANVVPEPETYALMLAGLGLMGLLARRRSKA
jgi:hypothetical protein